MKWYVVLVAFKLGKRYTVGVDSGRVSLSLSMSLSLSLDTSLIIEGTGQDKYVAKCWMLSELC